MGERSLFPIIPQKSKDVPVWVAELAHKGYTLFHDQPLERIKQRGGFGQNEIALYLAEYAQHLEKRLRALEAE